MEVEAEGIEEEEVVGAERDKVSHYFNVGVKAIELRRRGFNPPPH